MATVGNDTELRAALEALETALGTPLVSGEHATWSERVAGCWSRVHTIASRQLDQVHPQLFAEILETDAELAQRIEQLKAEDEAIKSELAGLNDRIAKLARRTPFAERDELRTNEER